MRIVPSSIIKNYPLKIINIHPALLPAFNGLNAQKQSLDSGAKVAGCSVHFINEELDAGAIIEQAVVAIEEKDSEEKLTAKIFIEDHLLLPQVVKAVSKGKLYFDGTWWVKI